MVSSKYMLPPYSELFGKPSMPKAAILLSLYIVVFEICFYYVPITAGLYPAAAFALVTIYFGGALFLPIIYITTIALGLIAHVPLQFLYVLPLAITLEAALGSYLLRANKVDPLFRKYSDTFYLLLTVAAISLITPTLFAIDLALRGASLGSLAWGHGYAASICEYLIIAPFLLRWFAKPKFARTPVEIIELIIVFGSLIFLSYMHFQMQIETVFSIPLIYLIYIPLFWIALRLRPRFVTLAVLISAVLALLSVLGSSPAETLDERFFNMELFLITLATAFYIIVSQEEDRRRNTNLMRNQLATLENAVARITSESKAKNDFIAILAHELRNPLAPVVSAIDLMRLKKEREKEETETLEMMGNRMTAVRRLLDDLLDISRISEGKVALKQEQVNIVSVLEQAILSTSHHRKELHQALSYKPKNKPIHVLGDAMRLEQVFSNLLTNASKYSKSGDTISINLTCTNDSVEISIIDEGVGIHPDSLNNIFLPFHQEEQGERTKKGLGIGLALVKSFVEMHGGTVKAESVGREFGSKFIVYLPLSK